MKIERTFVIDAPRQRVWDFITSPEKVAPCIPGCEGVTENVAGHYHAVIRTKVGPIRTVFRVEIDKLEERPPEYARYSTRGEEGSRASSLKAISTLALEEISPAQTGVSYTSDINLMGRLGKFGTGMMQKIADGIGNEFVAALKARLEGDDVHPGIAVDEPLSNDKLNPMWLAVIKGVRAL